MPVPVFGIIDDRMSDFIGMDPQLVHPSGYRTHFHQAVALFFVRRNYIITVKLLQAPEMRQGLLVISAIVLYRRINRSGIRQMTTQQGQVFLFDLAIFK
ncbi:hypothetical protein D3C86_1488620 [compost metagenome]